MSTSPNNSDNSSGSPSLLSHLKRFRYEQRGSQLHYRSPLTTCSDRRDINHSPRSPLPTSGTTHIPETPESELPSPPSPVLKTDGKKRVCKRITSDESEDQTSDSGLSKMEEINGSVSHKRIHAISSSEEESPLPPTKKFFSRLRTEEDNDTHASSTDLGSSDISRLTPSKQLTDTHLSKDKESEEKRGIIFISDNSSNESADVKKRTEAVKPKKEISATFSGKAHTGEKKGKRPPSKVSRRGPISSSSDSESEEEAMANRNGEIIDGIYSSEDTDDESADNVYRTEVMEYLNSSTLEELLRIPGCKKTKALVIMELRPFSNWNNLVLKLKKARSLSTDLLNTVFKFLQMQKTIVSLMNECQEISKDIEGAVAQLKEGKHEVCLAEQPQSLNPKMQLTSHQLLGLNWLILMHHKKLNGILADEMGLGKTVQAIAFLTYLFDEGNEGPHLIIVPASTLENWVRELNTWSKKLNVITYSGSQEERRYIRHRILRSDDCHFNVIVTTYNVVMNNAEDRVMIKSIPFHYVVFDEAHMLKNINSLRYKNMMKIKADHRMLLTGTPLQNNLAELMSLLIFVMPKMFDNRVDEIKKMFSGDTKKNSGGEGSTQFDQQRIEQAKEIMKPFVLRRLKTDVLRDLPKKTEAVERCTLSKTQEDAYNKLVARLSKQMKDRRENKVPNMTSENMMMELRKLANHPLLLRYKYDDELLKQMSKTMLKEPTHYQADSKLIFEDMQVMSDFELHRLCKMYKTMNKYKLTDDAVLDSGKLQYLDSVLDSLKSEGSRVLLFSQFTMVLDVLEEYLTIRDHSFLRLDGGTNVKERQDLVDKYNSDSSIYIFLLSTKAGGMGINLTSANVVIIHDIDFNPYNDKQAEDRCHRMGQRREVSVLRLISKNTIEELIFRCASEKLQLQHKLTTTDESGKQGPVLLSLLKEALDIK